MTKKKIWHNFHLNGTNTPNYSSDLLRTHCMLNNWSMRSCPLLKDTTPSLMGRFCTICIYSVLTVKQRWGDLGAERAWGRFKKSDSRTLRPPCTGEARGATWRAQVERDSQHWSQPQLFCPQPWSHHSLPPNITEQSQAIPAGPCVNFRPMEFGEIVIMNCCLEPLSLGEEQFVMQK